MVLISERPRNQLSLHTFKSALQKCKNFCSSFVLLTCILLLILTLMAFVFKPLENGVHIVYVDAVKKPYHVTNSKFLSVALDSSVIAEGFQRFNMKNPKFIKLMKALSPGYLRIGGTMADRLIFVPEKTPSFKANILREIDGGSCAYENKDCNSFQWPNFTMSGSEWLQLNELAIDTGFSILFDLNALIRNDDGSWNSDNAEKLITFSSDHQLNVEWELGNEPNAFKHVFNYAVNATQLAKDFIKLRNILNKYPLYKNSLLLGPDTTRPLPKHNQSEKYLQEFLKNVGNAVNAVTWHQYYFNGRLASLTDFINPENFDLLESQITKVKMIVGSVGHYNKSIWLGETSSAYGGGAPGYSNRYISSFIWLDKLGLAAKNGLDVVVRQSIFKGYYALITDIYEPTPDWWLSVLYKTFVGPEVIPCYSAASAFVRLYCQCTNRDSLYDQIPSITVFGFNMKATEAKVRLEGMLPYLKGPLSRMVFAYVVTSRDTFLSRYVALNGEALYLKPNGDLPPFKPKMANVQPYLIMPPFSSVFWVVPSPSASFCSPKMNA